MMGDVVSVVRSCVVIIFVFMLFVLFVIGNNDVMVLIIESVCLNGF